MAALEQPRAVRIRYRYPETSPCHHLNDKIGTLIEVRRRECRVDFDGESWTFPLDYLRLVDSEKPQGDISPATAEDAAPTPQPDHHKFLSKSP
jgi:hypothetical protein